MTRIAPYCLAFCLSMCQHALAQSLQATIEAESPATVSWMTAPPGTAGATVSQPSGTFSSLSIAAAGGAASLNAQLTHNATDWDFLLVADVSPPPSHLGSAQAELLLTLSAAPGAIAGIEFQLEMQADSPDPSHLQVDLGADGTTELAPSYQPLSTRHRNWTAELASGPIGIRITVDIVASVPPVRYVLRGKIREWSAHATPSGNGCSDLGQVWGGSLLYETNYHLDAVPSAQPTSLLQLRAAGLGNFHWFLAAPTSATLPLSLPQPLLGNCPTLQDVVIADFGATIGNSWHSGGNVMNVGWSLEVPLLPPGFSFYTQLGCVALTGGNPLNSRFGTTNVLRIDT